MKIAFKLIQLMAVALLSTSSFAQTYVVPSRGDTLVGRIDYVTTDSGETLLSIAQRFNIGVNAIEGANPGLDPVNPLPPDMHIVVPRQHILPSLPHDGIVINLPEMRMYYYPSSSHGVVMTYPIGIGKVGKTIPLTRTAVLRKVEHPVWIPPEDIRAFDKETMGIDLPKVMPAGPDNPLGPYAIYLRLPTYLIHSTIFPDSIGRRASFGCIRMNESDIKDFFPLIQAKTNVIIVDMPNKIGWQGNTLYLESHDPLEERSQESYAGFSGVADTIANTANTSVFVDWQLVHDLTESRDGLPHEIGFRIQ